MGYIIGNRFANPNAKIYAGTDEEFKKAKKENITSNVSFQEVPNIMPVKSSPLFGKIKKQAGSPDVTRTAPIFNDPRYTSSTLAIPTDNRTLNGLYRFFAETDPIVGASLKLHVDLPLANLKLGSCEDSGIQQHYKDQWERINGLKVLSDVTSEYFEIGDTTLFGAFDDTDYMWDQFAILNPDYVKIESTWINQKPLIKLIPDESLKRIVHTREPKFLFDQLPKDIIKYVFLNQEIPLDPNNTFHLAHLKRPYEVRGRSLIKRILKFLMLEDRFNQANFALATRHAVPLTIVKVGDPQSVEENHMVVYLQDDQLKMQSFKDMWKEFDGIVSEHSEGKFTKDIRKHNLFTLSLADKGEKQWNRIEFILRHKTPEEMVEIETPYATIRSTTGHGFVGLNPDTLISEKMSSKELIKRENPTLVTFDKFDFSIKANKIFDIDLTSQLSYFLGLWTADGNFNSSQGTILNISNADFGIINYVTSLENFGDKLPYYHVYDNDTLIFTPFRKLKESLLNYYGYKNKDKSVIKTGKEKIPQEILFNEDDKIFGSYLAGSLDGDGYITTNLNRIILSIGASKEYHHWLSLALLARGIESKVLRKGMSSKKGNGAWELTVRGKSNILRLIPFIKEFIQHSEKKILISQLEDKQKKIRESKWNSDIFDISDSLKDFLFSDTKDRVGQGAIPLTYLKNNLKMVPKSYLGCAKECEEKEILKNTHTVRVSKITTIKSESEYVYDLMLEHNPHTYITAGEGFLNTKNSGWVPNNEELNEVRDMMCYSEDTEVLTENGFKKYTEVTDDEKIACFDKNTNSLIYDFPVYKHEYDYKGEMIHFNARSTDVLVTPNHRMLAKHRKKEDWEVILAEDVTQDYKFRAAIDNYKGIDLPNTIEIAGEKVNTRDWFNFAGWYISEGSTTTDYSKVSITQTKKEGCIAIEKCLNTLPWKWNKYGDNYVICNSILRKYVIEEFGKNAIEKKIPKWMKNTSTNYLNILFNSYMCGDDNSRILLNDLITYTGNTSSKQLSNDVQEIAFKLGYAARIEIHENTTFHDPKTGIIHKIRPSGKLKGKPYATTYRVFCSKDKKSRFPGFAWAVKKKLGQLEPSLENINLPIKGKKYEWQKIDLNNLLNVFGSGDAVGKAMCVSGTTVRNQMKKQDIPIGLPGQRLPVYEWEDNDNIKRVPYEGKVWCFTTLTGFFITRRNGRIAIQGNSSFELDPNFCYDEITECLTKEGWKNYTELNRDTDIACFDPENNSLIYDKPSYINIQDYKGEMYHFKSRSMNMKVTPNHRMFLQRNEEWQIQLAENVKGLDKFRAFIDDYDGNEQPEYLEIAGKKVKAEDFFELAGWYLSEGSSSLQHEKYYRVDIVQTKKEGCLTLDNLFNRLPWNNKKYGNSYSINSLKLASYMVENFGKGSENKKIPRWVINAKKSLLEKLFFAWLAGDGTKWLKKDGDIFYQGYSTSEQLIDDMQEIAFKLGFASHKRFRKVEKTKLPQSQNFTTERKDGTAYLNGWFLNITKGYKMKYPTISNRTNIKELPGISLDTIPMINNRVDWEKVNLQNLIEQTHGVLKPIAEALNVSIGTICKQSKKIGFNAKIGGSGNIKGGKIFTPKHILKKYYEGKIWCPTVKTGIIITRRKGKIAIQGQSIVYHYGINVEYYGSNGRMLPLGPEFDRIYRLKFIGMGVHEQLLAGQGGSYSQAYMNLEVQRQRYLNLQLKLETLVHSGWFKTVADMCGFYRVKQAVSGSYVSSKQKWGTKDTFKKTLIESFSSLRDSQDNVDFQSFINKKNAEYEKGIQKQSREYVYPKLDWGGMSAASDENLKNYIKWLAQNKPYLVDDATLARLANLDRDTQEKTYIKDLERKKDRYMKISKQGLLPFVDKGKGASGGGGFDLGSMGGPDMGGVDVDMGGSPAGEGSFAEMGGGPDAAIGEGGDATPSAEGVMPAGGGNIAASSLTWKGIENDLKQTTAKEDLIMISENAELKKEQKLSHTAVVKAVKEIF